MLNTTFEEETKHRKSVKQEFNSVIKKIREIYTSVAGLQYG